MIIGMEDMIGGEKMRRERVRKEGFGKKEENG